MILRRAKGSMRARTVKRPAGSEPCAAAIPARLPNRPLPATQARIQNPFSKEFSGAPLAEVPDFGYSMSPPTRPQRGR
jgi:hypothetical protein